MEYPGLLGNVGKCPISCEGALQEVHLKYQNEQTAMRSDTCYISE